jgi:hypothetical protein
MIQSDMYLMKAQLLLAEAHSERNPALKIDLANMARAYLRLADQAVRNAQNGLETTKDPDQA